MMSCDECRTLWNKEEPFDLSLHAEVQDTACEGWEMLVHLMRQAMEQERTVFAPFREIPRELDAQIVTLPSEIGAWTQLEEMYLYFSPVTYLPSEVGLLQNLRKFVMYTSPRFHWYPWEVTRCAALESTSQSTRNMYGNYKNRAPFPDLLTPESQAQLEIMAPQGCSVCGDALSPGEVHHRWTSQWVGTDVMPLLVYACSQRCVDALPDGPPSFLARPHTGGAALEQPERLRRRVRREPE